MPLVVQEVGGSSLPSQQWILNAWVKSEKTQKQTGDTIMTESSASWWVDWKSWSAPGEGEVWRSGWCSEVVCDSESPVMLVHILSVTMWGAGLDEAVDSEKLLFQIFCNFVIWQFYPILKLLNNENVNEFLKLLFHFSKHLIIVILFFVCSPMKLQSFTTFWTTLINFKLH